MQLASIQSRRGELQRHHATTSARLRQHFLQIQAARCRRGQPNRWLKLTFSPIHAAMMYCQKCRTSLRLDDSLANLNPAAFDLLVGMRRNFSCITRTLTLQGLLSDHYLRVLPLNSTIPESGKPSTIKQLPSITHPHISERY